MPLQEISVFFPPSLAILSGMALQGLALLLRCRPLLICGAFLAVAAALAERDAAFIAGQLLILCLCWRPCARKKYCGCRIERRRGDQKRPRSGGL